MTIPASSPRFVWRRALTLLSLSCLSCGASSGASSDATPGAAEPPLAARAAAPTLGDAAIPGWVRVNCAPETFTLKDGLIVSTGKPTGVLRSERMYENFILEVEWRHLQPGGNAGIFVWSDPLPARGVPFTRSIEVQVLDGTETANYTSDGDLFAIHGASCVPDRPHPAGWERCLPDERRARPSPEWNRYVITARDGRIELDVNGKVVSGVSNCLPRKGYVCLEAEGSECHFRIVRLEELPASEPPPDAAAIAEAADPAWRSLYCGLDLRTFTTTRLQREHWQARDWVLATDGDGGPLATAANFGDVEVRLDWKLATGATAPRKAVVTIGAARLDLAALLAASAAPGATTTTGARALRAPKAGEWNRLEATYRGGHLHYSINGQAGGEATAFPFAGSAPIVLDCDGEAEFASFFARPLR